MNLLLESLAACRPCTPEVREAGWSSPDSGLLPSNLPKC